MKSHSNTHDMLHKVMSNGLKIYPVSKRYKFAVCIEDPRGVIYKHPKTIGEYKHTTKTINKALKEALKFVYYKIVH